MGADNDETGSFYIFFRIIQIITLIVCFGLLASIVSAYNQAGLPVPSAVLCLFIVAVLLTVWSICILITYLRALNVDYTIAFIDFLGMIALIVGVVLLSNAVNGDCINLSAAAAYAGVSTDQILAYLQAQQSSTANLSGGEQYGKYCGLLKAAWGLGIANIFFFFLTAMSGYQIAAAFQQRMRKRRGGSRSRTIVEEEIAVAPVVIQQPAMREYVVAADPPRRKGTGKKRSSSHRKGGDVERRESRRTSRTDYYN